MTKTKKRKIFKNILAVILIAVFIWTIKPSSKTVIDIFGEETGGIINAVVDLFSFEDIIDNNTGAETLAQVPSWDGKTAYIPINNNQPDFTDEEKQSIEPFELYSELDSLGRCGVAYANICKELMPTEGRESISSVKPSGWVNNPYDFVDGGYLYNRCHLIGFQLAGENANKLNLITGTRYLNIEGMLPFENMIDDYVDETGNHVLFRVTPIYDGNNLVCSGVQMEAWSVEDNGDGICFNVYSYNAQPGVEIDYATGDNWLAE